MRQLLNVSATDLFHFANRFDSANTTAVQERPAPAAARDELLEIFRMYNPSDYRTPIGIHMMGTTKCCATGTCVDPMGIGVVC